MNTYIALITYTQQGLSSISDAPNRARAIRDFALKRNVRIIDFYWTTGGYDGVLIFRGDELDASALMLHIGSLGNATTELCRAHDIEEFEKILPVMAELR